MRAGFVLLLAVLAIVVAFDGPTEDIVQGLQVPGVTSAWYSGYLSFGRNSHFHYVLFPSQHDPDNDPVLLWLNGGPGCSSMIGMSYENGPFKFLENSTTMVANPYSWNRKANLLYIESPGGVGFSIGSTANVSDASVREDNLQAMLTFYAKFPSLRSNEFYISGQSYAGIYVPHLAEAIHFYNTKSSTSLPINLKGIAVGNACTDPLECYTPGPNGTSLFQYEFLYKHGFYTDLEYSKMRAACVMGYDSDFCRGIRDRMDAFFDSTKTSILNIYAKCFGVGQSNERKTKIFQSGRRKIVQGDLDCDDQKGAINFFGSAIHRELMHIRPDAPAWAPCNDPLYQNYSMDPRASYYLYPGLLKAGYRVWVYSGDVDADVPLTGTKNWIEKFREEFSLPVMEPWREWWVLGKHSYEDFVGGMIWRIRNMTLVTFKFAGHMVPKDQPAAAYDMIAAFLEDSVLPDKPQNKTM